MGQSESKRDKRANLCGFAATKKTTAEKGRTLLLPDETSDHLATWLQWPHPFTYGEMVSATIDVCVTSYTLTSDILYITQI